MSDATPNRVGFVAIGRNEGPRLRQCLESIVRQADFSPPEEIGLSPPEEASFSPPERPIIYVDSGSTDDSVTFARNLGVEVVQLDQSTPFTAARSRNAGVRRLLELHPSIEFVQMIDGDCQIIEGWLASALSHMLANPRAAVVCGRRRERFPDASIYNRLCDMEWDTEVGLAEWCGGDALTRVQAFKQVQGYNDSIIAGEEPEFCLRLRINGWTIHRIACDMTLHDARVTQFGQWWKRMVRAGHAYAQGRSMHGKSHRFFVRPVRSIVEWTIILPLLAIGLAWPTWGLSLLLLPFGYSVLWFRIYKDRVDYGDLRQHASLYASYVMLGKFAQLMGMVKFWINRARGKQSAIIEYKGAGFPELKPAAAAAVVQTGATHS